MPKNMHNLFLIKIIILFPLILILTPELVPALMTREELLNSFLLQEASLCPPDTFSCHDRLKCVNKTDICNHVPDCFDGSDEGEEHGCDSTCSPGSFQCKESKKCIHNGWLCDGAIDCGFSTGFLLDTSDEDGEKCSNLTSTCKSNQIKCRDKITCIDISMLCDGFSDCPDNSDSHEFCENTTVCNNSICKYGCKPSFSNEPLCYCPEAKEFNGTDCIATDPCLFATTCDQICNQTEDGNKECSCVSGYLLVNNKECRAINGHRNESARILYQDASDIKYMNLDGTNTTHPIYNSKEKNVALLGLTFDYPNSTVCWINHSNKTSIMRCAISGNLSVYWDLPQPYLYSFEDVYELTYDWATWNYYFVDDGREIIFMCKDNLVLCKTIVGTDVSKPRGIAVDSLTTSLFFTVWGTSGAKLERASLDGSNRKILVDTKIVYPDSLVLDLPVQQIYWVDKFLDSIERVDYNGLNRKTIFRGIQLLRYISLFENSLYVVTSKEILSLHKLHASNFTVLASNLTSPFALHIYHAQRQPQIRDVCLTSGCPELCVAWHEEPKYKCLCSEGLYLSEDEKSCQPYDYTKTQFLVYSKPAPGGIRSVLLTPNSSYGAEAMIPVTAQISNAALDVDVLSHKIYYSDHFRIMSKGLLNTTSTVYIDRISRTEGISIDWSSRNIYWTDNGLGLIYVGKLDDPKVKKLLVNTDLDGLKSIAIYPQKGLLFWSIISPGHIPKGYIEQSWSNGQNRKKLIENLVQPLGLTLDTDRGYLYYVDAYVYAIERIYLNGINSRKEVIFTLPNGRSNLRGIPQGMSYYNGYLYITAGKIYKISINAQQDRFNIVLNDTGVGIRVYDASLQRGTTSCLGNNGCPEFCFPIPVSPNSSCECSDGRLPSDDGRRCEEIKDYKHPLACNATQFECRKFPKCIDNKFVCDGETQCADGSDEAIGPTGPCDFGTGLCGKNYFDCGGTVCIPSRLLCDGISQCENGADEQFALCSTNSNNTRDSCHADLEFQCKISKRCIPKSWTCDNTFDCMASEITDSSDESESAGCSVDQGCDEDFQFKCSNGICIPLASYCNGFDDCPDGSDEKLCSNITCTPMNPYYCASDAKCLQPEQFCDGICQCSDFSDEANCPANHTLMNCELAGVRIHDFGTINTVNSYCDLGPPSIRHLSLEHCINITCSGNSSFHCLDSNLCIPLKFQCDGVKDCNDGSDELSCPTPVPKCPYPGLLCDKKTKCVKGSKICDQILDCNDHADESQMCDIPCSTLNCTDTCIKTPLGPRCTCSLQGSHLLPDNRTCSLSHPCEVFGTCSQACHKIGQRYQCLCLPGYRMLQDGFTCVSLSHEVPFLVFSNRHELRGINLRTSQFNSLISNLRNSIAIDFYYDWKKNGSIGVFFTDVLDDRIYRGNLIGGSLINIEVVIQTGLATAEGLAVDWIGENIYWVESNLDQIEVATLNGSFRKTLISGNMVSPRSIALDPREGLLFWTDWEQSDPRIERATMSGEDRQIILRVKQSEGSWPNGLTLDYVNKRIFYCDARLDSIHTVKYDGSDFQTILSEHEALSHPFAITLFENDLFWSDWRSNSVMRVNKFTGGNATTIHRTYTQPFDVKVIHSSRQPRDIDNPCAKSKCTHLCLLSSNSTYACACPHLMMLSKDDNYTCVSHEKMLLFSRLNEIRAVYLDQPYYHSAPPISLNLIINPSNLHFVAKYKQIYWSDVQSGETKRANITSPSIRTLIDASAGKPLAIAVDWISELIFIAVQNPFRNSICVSDLNGQYFSTVMFGKSNLRNVNSLALDPSKGLMYFPDGATKGQFTIQVAQMDGSDARVLSNNRDNPSLESPVSLSYDFTSDRLYWLNYNEHREVQYYDVKLRSVKTVSFVEDYQANVITIYKNVIYFASDKEDAIYKVDKSTGNYPVVVRNNTEGVFSLRIYDPEEQNGTNACSVNKGGCQHLCIPTGPITKVCKCALGFFVDPKNRNRCLSQSTVLVYADSSGVRGVSPFPENTEDLLVPIPLVSFATDIEVDDANGYLYWLDNDKGRISRIKREGTEKEVVLSNLDSVIGLAVDWNAGNMYWTNLKDPMIEVSHVNGSSRYVLINTGLDKPQNLAIDPSKGFLFWSDISKGHIERTQLDGSDRKVIVYGDNMKPGDITLDMENFRIYWCDSTADTIESTDYDGGDRQVVYKTESESHIHSPIIGKDYMYWVDMSHQRGSIMRAPLGSFKPVETVKRDLGVTIKDLTMFSKERQKGRNPCYVQNGGCADLCLFNGTYPVCACAHGKIGADLKSCEAYDAFIVYSRVQSIETIHLGDSVNPNSPYAPISSHDHIRNAIGLAYDYKRHTLFYSDVQLGTINRVHFNGTNFTSIAEKQGSVEGLFYEPAHEDLYWTCSNDASINRMNPYGIRKRVEKVVKLGVNDRPRGIACDACGMQIFWSNWDANRPSIQRSSMSGYNIVSIITTNIRMPNGLTVDTESKHLYWIDARLDKIERCNFDGSNRVVIGTDKPKHAFAIAVYGDYLYWTDWVLLSVLRANKFNAYDVTVLRKNIPKPMGIVVVSNTSPTCSSNPCSILNGGCSEICIPVNGNATCSCTSNDRVLQPEDGRCIVQQALRNCKADEFQCSSGFCIPYELSCDKIEHCPDGSDESIIYCSTRKCKEGFFRCSNNRCILEKFVCNGVINCGSGLGEDEENCGHHISLCPSTKFQCRNGSCVENEIDCVQTPTEVNCTQLCCDEDKYFCPKGLRTEKVDECIEKNIICDCNTIVSRPGNCLSSEIHPIDNLGCPGDYFKCSDGQCIISAWKCDNDRDCSNDEIDCDYQCKPGHLLCGSGECISLMHECDGQPDCADGGDEKFCTNRTCEDHQFQCNVTGRCISSEWVCDNDFDCPLSDTSDEDPALCTSTKRKPPSISICTAKEFQCLNGICIPKESYCDRKHDCDRGEDEPESCSYNKCPNSTFVCKGSGQCISLNSTCNKIKDCIDGSDESIELCGDVNYCTGDDQFLCSNKACVNETVLCNGLNDCGDFSDEILCNINECDQPGTCQHICIEKKIGYQCKCTPGFKTDPSNPSLCIDVDECAMRKCSQRCVNTIGSYKCSCNENYLLREDQHSCKSKDHSTTEIMFSNQYYIRMVDLHRNEKILAQNLTNAVALDYDYRNSCIYWSDVTAYGSSIKRMCNIFNDKPNVEEVLHHITVQSPDGIAVDWVGGNLYFCDKGTDTIEVSKLDGRFRKVLINEGLHEPRAIVLDPFRGYFYWSDWGENPHIGKAGMDGSNAILIITDGLGWPNALTISYETQEIWWADAREDYLAVADLNGGNRQIVHVRGPYNPNARVHHIFALSVFEDYIYFSDWELKSVERCHKYSGENQTTVVSSIHRPMDVKVYHPHRQPDIPVNPCADNNGGCPGLCLLAPEGGRVCVCPEDFVLSADGKTCEPNCTSSQFVCKSTYRCIPMWWKCDGSDDCGDLSDEPSSCPKFICTPGQYQCKDGINCLHPSHICDLKSDCINGTDEENCDQHTCFVTQFKCEGNGTTQSFCIPSYKKCDGISDCPLGQDEYQCLPNNCPKNQFQCNNSRCIQQEWVCDKEKDCTDGSDELANCTQRVCDDDKFKCSTGKCIPRNWKCDGEKDCDEEDDEKGCTTPENQTCEPTYFKCNNGRCIPGRWRCDFDDDCGDSSDEKNCVPRNCSESEFRCVVDGRCIRGSYRCNGEFNCEDHSDELDCSSVTACGSHEFKCTNPQFCIQASWRCDADEDCLDGSDEANCTRQACHPDQFSCKNGLDCIASNWVCDLEADCADGSDEDVSLCATRSCAPGRFRCRNNACIPYSKTCDGKFDCPDQSDENIGLCVGKWTCQQSGMFRCDNKLCINASHVCNFVDDCGDFSDEKSCETVSMCPFGSCSQICSWKPRTLETTDHRAPNYTCHCTEGFDLVPKSDSLTECIAKNEPMSLLIASESRLQTLDPRKPYSNESFGLAHTVGKIEAIDYLIDTDESIKLYWSSRETKTIQSAMYHSKYGNSLDSFQYLSRKKRDEVSTAQGIHVIITGLDEPRGVAVCWLTKRIYFLDSGLNTLSVSTLDGKTRMVLINKNLLEPHDIVLDPELGKLFFSNWIDQKVEVANMDGSNRQTLATSPYPAGLAIDHGARPKRLYFCDLKSHSIESVTLDGRDRRIIKRFIGGKTRPYRIDVFEDTLYISTYQNNQLFKMNKFGKGNYSEISQTMLITADVVVVQSSKQLKSSDPCQNLTCTSPGLCLLSGPGKAHCVCPDSKPAIKRTAERYECNVTTSTTCDLQCKEGLCKLGANGPYCLCNPLYEGPRCDRYRCSGYCYNKGLCYQDLIATIPGSSGVIPLKCNCPPNYTGPRCETPFTNCEGKCENNGTCDEIRNACNCPEGFTGRFCQNCVDFQCDNGGHCTKDKNRKPHCECLNGYSGIRCEISKCPNSCSDRGRCKLRTSDNSPECVCNQGYGGLHCESDLCVGHCLNGGSCFRASSGIGCTCTANFTGQRCNTPICECKNCPRGDKLCQCPKTGLPSICDNDKYAVCSSEYCQNRGSCVIIRNQAYCACPDKFTGLRCQNSVPKSPCQNHLCLHNGLCIVAVKKPACICPEEWSGSKCQNRNNCYKYCFNDGECVVNPDSNFEPTCLCSGNFYGVRCQYSKVTDTGSLDTEQGVTWILVLVFIVVAVAVAGFSGCAAYVIMRRKQGRPFMHVRMHDNGTVEINNPMFLKEDDDTNHRGSEPSLVFDSDKVLLQGTNFANPLYQDGAEGSGVSEEKKGLLTNDEYSTENHPLADPMA